MSRATTLGSLAERLGIGGRIPRSLHSVPIRWTSARRYLGLARARRCRATGRVEPLDVRLSRRLLVMGEAQMVDTLLHEVAHLIAFGVGETGHGRVWRLLAAGLGARPETRVTA